VRAGKIRAYAVTARKRLATAPDIATVDEADVPGFYMSIWSAAKECGSGPISSPTVAYHDQFGSLAKRRSIDTAIFAPDYL